MTCNHTTSTSGSIAATTFSSLQQTQLLCGQAAIDKTWLCTQPTKRPNFSSPLSHSLLFFSPLCLCLVLSSLLSCLCLLFFFSSVRHAMSWTWAFDPNSLSSLWFDFIQSLYLWSVDHPLDFGNRSLVLGHCGLWRRGGNRGSCPNCWRNWMQNFTQRERERERERGREDLNIFLGFLFMGYSFFWVEDAHEWWYTR